MEVLAFLAVVWAGARGMEMLLTPAHIGASTEYRDAKHTKTAEGVAKMKPGKAPPRPVDSSGKPVPETFAPAAKRTVESGKEWAAKTEEKLRDRWERRYPDLIDEADTAREWVREEKEKSERYRDIDDMARRDARREKHEKRRPEGKRVPPKNDGGPSSASRPGGGKPGPGGGGGGKSAPGREKKRKSRKDDSFPDPEPDYEVTLERTDTKPKEEKPMPELEKSQPEPEPQRDGDEPGSEVIHTGPDHTPAEPSGASPAPGGMHHMGGELSLKDALRKFDGLANDACEAAETASAIVAQDQKIVDLMERIAAECASLNVDPISVAELDAVGEAVELQSAACKRHYAAAQTEAEGTVAAADRAWKQDAGIDQAVRDGDIATPAQGGFYVEGQS